MGGQIKQERIAGAREKVTAATPARERLLKLFDADSFVELDTFVAAERGGAGVVCGFGSVLGGPVYAFAQDGGPVGAAQAVKIRKLYDMALKTGAPVVGIYDSAGIRLAEGVGALAAYSEMLRYVSGLSGVVPQLSLVLGDCVGAGAMMASAADFLIMSESAGLYATPLTAASPEGTGSAASAGASGVAHMVAKDEAEAIAAAQKLLTYLPLNNLASSPVTTFIEPQLLAQADADTPVEQVLRSVVDSGSEMEMFPAFGAGVCAVMATMGGYPCGIVATRGAALDADDCAKIAKLVSVWDSFQLPVITLVNTPGMKEAEGALCQNVRDMAKVAHIYAEATTAKVALITGRAYGSAYIALAGRDCCADYAVAWPTAMIAALAPETAVALMHGDEISQEKSRQQLEQDYIDGEASPLTAAQDGYIDDVIEPSLTRPCLLAALDLLAAKRVHRNPKKHGNIPF